MSDIKNSIIQCLCGRICRATMNNCPSCGLDLADLAYHHSNKVK